MNTVKAETAKKLIKACKVTELREKAFLDLTYHSGLRPAEDAQQQREAGHGDVDNLTRGFGIPGHCGVCWICALQYSSRSTTVRSIVISGDHPVSAVRRE